MKKYIIKRLLWSVVILGIVAFLLYVLMRSLPTSYLEQIARQKSQQPGSRTFEEWMQQLSATYGMDKGIIPGFVAWLSKAVRLDFGDSWKYTIPVTQKFVQVVSISFWISLIVMILEVAISIPLGIIAATKQYSMADNVISVVALAGISLPTFFLASLLKLIFAVNLKWFDLNGLVSRNHDFLSPAGQRWDIAMHLVLPIMTLTIASRVVFHHAFRNTLITLVTIWGSSLPALFSGAMITEQLFSIPGIGYTSYQAMVSGDIPFSMFYLVFIAILTLIGNLLTDILYAVVDPRVRIA